MANYTDQSTADPAALQLSQRGELTAILDIPLAGRPGHTLAEALPDEPADSARELGLYWTIGRAILDQQAAEGWGTGVINRLADDLRAEFPELRGLGRSNVHYMRAMAAAWPKEAVVQQAVGQFAVGSHHRLVGQA